MADVTVVIVAYRSQGTIGNVLRALDRAHAEGLAECVLVSNDCSDGSADKARRDHPWVQVIQNDANIGFGRGCNAAFESVRTPYMLLLNPDAVIEVDAIRCMLTFMERCPAAGIAAPAIKDGAGHLQPAGMLPTPWRLIKASAGFRDSYPEQRPILPGERPFRTSWLCGAVMLIRRELFESLGRFDPRFFLYFEETDFCRRATAAGAEIWAIGEAVAEHAGGTSARQVSNQLYFDCLPEYYFSSRFYYLVKHHGYFAAALTDVGEYLALAGRCLLSRLRGRTDSSGFHARRRGGLCSLPNYV